MVQGGVGSSAYLPVPLAVLISNEPTLAAAGYVLAFAIPFVVSVIRNAQTAGKAR
jgi:hypothetical protein